jgi:signal transduction histidine kinase
LHKQEDKEELERLGLARRLHETLAQDLAAIGYQLDAVIAEQELAQNHRNELRSIRMEVMRVAREFRDVIYRLRIIGRNELENALSELLSGKDLDLNLTYPALQPHAR